MTLGEFREQTKDLSDEMLVVLARDGEGNSYSPLLEVETAIYDPETTYGGVIYPEDFYHAGDRDGKKAVVLWPTN